MINETIYQLIFDEISAFLPLAWERVVIYLEYGEDSYEISFYLKQNGVYTKCFDLSEISEEEMLDAFERIDETVSQERNKLPSEKWTNMTMLIENDGSMHVDFDYSDLTDAAYQHNKEWKKHYLV